MAKSRFWFQAHWLVGITAGVVLAVMGFTGAMMSFQDQILDALNGDARQVEVKGERLAMPVLLTQAQAEADRIGGRVRLVSVPPQGDGAIRVLFLAGDDEVIRYLNPYTGDWHSGGATGEHFFELLEEIHRGFITDRLAGDSVGRRIFDASAILLVGLVLTGLYLRWPRRFTNWRNWFVIETRLRGRGFLYSMHAVIGTYVLPLLLVSALTGLYFAYEWYGDMLEKLTGVQPVVEAELKSKELVAPDVTQVWNSVETVTAGHALGKIVIRLPKAGDEPLRVQYVDVGAPLTDVNTIKIDPSDSQVLSHQRYEDKQAGGKLLSSMLAIHKGSYFGLVGTVLLMLSSLALPLFVITGWMMYLDRRRVEERARKRQAASAAAA
ncbi:PepSY-associated TM helix domain-containing protein [Steroidobacter sp.]|uniref:PepSY-associated TM helix domain-containing protein n=1 Tax=Steroidobacter sp. TaxID=1978227 RepID=UPI001A3FD0F1|nr:PepSY-associated TM helix domain-containing protein [Steroidobacter sp.]MBL8270998.1 PepSY domain-containing protein [Steroidobacter sp.]